MNHKVDYLLPDEEYKPKQPDWEKIQNYKNLSYNLSIHNYRPVGPEGHAHERDIMTPEPVLLKVIHLYHFQGPAPRSDITMDDITDFPTQKIVALEESRPYEEGRYRPPSMPAYAGIFPTHLYLYRGKKYSWCSCGHT